MQAPDRANGLEAGSGGPRGDEPDEALVRAIARGDRAALADLYDKYASFLMSLAIRVVRDRREAEDLLHDVFLEVWKSAVDYDPRRGRVRTWLAIRMRSRALDRQKSARVSRHAAGPEGDAVLERAPAETTADGSADHARVRAAVDGLTAEQRQVVELAYFDGLSCSEISAAIAVPIGTVKSRMAAAMSRLRGSLGALPGDAPSAIVARPDARAPS